MNTLNTKTVEIKENYFGSYRIGFPDSSAMLCATFHDGFEPEINKQHAERIVNSWNEYDKLKEDNALLIEALQEDMKLISHLSKKYELNRFITEPCISRLNKVKELLNNIKTTQL